MVEHFVQAGRNDCEFVFGADIRAGVEIAVGGPIHGPEDGVQRMLQHARDGEVDQDDDERDRRNGEPGRERHTVAARFEQACQHDVDRDGVSRMFRHWCGHCQLAGASVAHGCFRLYGSASHVDRLGLRFRRRAGKHMEVPVLIGLDDHDCVDERICIDQFDRTSTMSVRRAAPERAERLSLTD